MLKQTQPDPKMNIWCTAVVLSLIVCALSPETYQKRSPDDVCRPQARLRQGSSVPVTPDVWGKKKRFLIRRTRTVCSIVQGSDFARTLRVCNPFESHSFNNFLRYL